MSSNFFDPEAERLPRQKINSFKQKSSYDFRYKNIRSLIRDGQIKSFTDIFLNIPKTVVYKDLGVNFDRFNNGIINPSRFTLQDIFNLAELLEIDEVEFLLMVYDQTLIARRSKRQI